MLDKTTALDLMAFGIPILVLGDPAQLPPLSGAGYFTHSKEFPPDSPDVMLTEVHRQSLDSPVLTMATRVRLGKTLKTGTYGDSKVVVSSEGFYSLSYKADRRQVICGTNRLRTNVNDDTREYLGIDSHLPQPGEKLVCLRNSKRYELLNGELYTVVKSSDMKDDRFAELVLTDPAGGEDKVVKAWIGCWSGEEMKSKPFKERCVAEEFDFGYALTCHKSQGSQYDHTLLLDESACFREDAGRWLYTALTRAAKTVRVVKRY
jgi:exodeoxyribonuclease-5